MDTVHVDARPYPLTVDPGETAIIVVDMQYGFASPGGAWDREGADVSGLRAIVEPISRVLAAARRADMRVVYTVMDFEGPGIPEELWNDARRARWIADVGSDTRAAHAPGLPAGATDTDILAELAPQPDDAVVVKPRHSGFFNTNLHAVLQDLGVTTLVFTGGTTSACLGLTLTDAYFRDYRCLLLSDCTAELIGSHFSRTNHDATLWLVEVAFGWVSDSAALVQALAAAPAAGAAASAR